MTRVFSQLVPCQLCQALTSPETHPILGSPVCHDCLVCHNYEDANERHAGTTDGLPMFSVEFEVCDSSIRWQADRALILLKHGFLRTCDISVTDEYKSPMYLGLSAFQQVLPILDTLKYLVDNCCGTHIHIDCPAKQLVRIHQSALFSPLIHYLGTHKEETTNFWGRCTSDVVRTDTRYETVEFRLPRFRSGEQYLRVVRFCRQVGFFLNFHLKQHYPYNAPLTPSQIGACLLSQYLQMREGAGQEGRNAHV